MITAHTESRFLPFLLSAWSWEEKIPLAKSSLEKTWLFHEIGRCYLELNKAEAAQTYGQMSLQSADEEGNVEWQLHAYVLIAQAQGKGISTDFVLGMDTACLLSILVKTPQI